jgi:pseudaminic acid synthase
MNSLTIDNRIIAPDYPPYVIAELSANHNGKIETAFKLIDQAKLAGADAVKLQTYKPDTITLNCSTEDFQIQGGLWNGRTLYDLYKEAHMPWEWHKPLFDHAKKVGVTIFSSPFDNTAVDLLEDLNAPAYKIASFEVIDLPLIKYAASTGKPLIISTGMASMEEIHEAIDAAKSSGCNQLAILHCVSGYPATAAEYNLQTIIDMRERFGTITGLSDHTLDNTTAITSIAMGASIIEKHFTLDRNGRGPDDSFSLEPEDLKALCAGALTAWEALGTVSYERQNSEKANIKFRRSLYFVKDAKVGELVTEAHIRSVRPGFGLAPKFFEEIIGRKLIKPVTVGVPVNWDFFNLK